MPILIKPDGTRVIIDKISLHGVDIELCESETHTSMAKITAQGYGLLVTPDELASLLPKLHDIKVAALARNLEREKKKD